MTTLATQVPKAVHKDYIPATTDLPPGENSFVSWITMDNVDRELDVVVAANIDFTSEYLGVKGDPSHPGNPVVMMFHDYQRVPLGRCAWIKLAKPSPQRSFSGLYAKTVVASDSDSMKIFALIQERIVRGISIGFRPPDDFKSGEWGPPTAEEIKLRPDWAKARRIIRRCVMYEYSVCSIGLNQMALITAVSKGLITIPSQWKGFLMATIKPDSRVGTPDGLGLVKSLTTEGTPDDCENFLCGTPSAPVARVELLTPSGEPTGTHQAFLVSALKAMDEDDDKSLEDEARIDTADTTHGSNGFMVGQHVKMAGSAGGGCGVVKSLKVRGSHTGPDKMPMDASHDEPVYEVDEHDDDHKCMGSMKCFRAAHMKDFDMAPVTMSVRGKKAGMHEGSMTAGGAIVPEDDAEEHDDGEHDDESEASEKPGMLLAKGMHVSWEKHKDVLPGMGRVKSIHTAGRVPGAVNHAEATEEMPHARIERYKHMGDPMTMHASGEHVAMPCAKCKALDVMRLTPAKEEMGEKAMVSGADGTPFVMADMAPQSKGVIAFTASPVVQGGWNAAAARAKLRKTYGNDIAKFRKCFAWYDPKAFDDPNACGLLVKDVRAGQVVIVREAVEEALKNVDRVGMPLGDKPAVKAALERYRSEWADDEPEATEDKSFEDVSGEELERRVENIVRKLFAPRSDEAVAQSVLDQLNGAI